MNPLVGTCPVADWEQLARFILESNRFRRNDNTVKPEAFMPHPYLELSLTRHRELAAEELWRIGFGIAAERGRNLYARADINAAIVRLNKLQIEPDPLDKNPNHANVKGWPVAKSAQKELAIELAAAAVLEYAPTWER
jgi:hypothetical protein